MAGRIAVPARILALDEIAIVDRLAIAKAQVLEFELALVAGQHDVSGLIQERSHAPVPAFRDAADVVDLAGLIPLGTKPR